MFKKPKFINTNNFFKAPKYIDIVLFFKHLSLMTKSGVNINDSLAVISEQTRSKKLKTILETTIDDIQNGKMLAESMKKFPYAFSELEVNLVRIGEKSGTLDENLTYLSDHLTDNYKMRKKIIGAMIYPIIILIGLTGIGAFITLYVFPKMKSFYADFDEQLPLATRVLMKISDLAQAYGVFAFIVVFVAIVVVIIILRLPQVKLPRDRIILHIPIFGSLILKQQLVLFTRNFGILVKSGVPVVKALHITSKSLTNAKVKLDVETLADEINTGKGIAEVLDNISDTPIPTMLIKMMDIGNKTGSLSDVSLYLSDFYADEVDNITSNLATTLEPVLLIIVGVFVGFVAFAILSPIYSITGSIGMQ